MEGLIFYAHADDDDACFLSVELWHGRVRYAYDTTGECGGGGGGGGGGGRGDGSTPGSGHRVMENRVPINDNQWHGVSVTRLSANRHLLRVGLPTTQLLETFFSFLNFLLMALQFY